LLIGLWLIDAAVELVRAPGWESTVNIALGTASILGVQLFALAFDGLMRDAAAHVQADIDQHKKLLISDRVSRAVAEDYRHRYAALVGHIVPLLEEFSRATSFDGDLARRARAQSRQLRALFDQYKTFDHPLMQQLRPAVDAAERNHVEIAVDLSGQLPELGAEQISRLATPVARALAADIDAAHLVVSAEADDLSVSVVCRGVREPQDLAAGLAADGDAEITTLEDTVWMIISHSRTDRAGP
jgi:hypothetical protein